MIYAQGAHNGNIAQLCGKRLMGMNIHIHAEADSKPFPEGLEFLENTVTLVRYTDGRKFMHALWEQDCNHVLICRCINYEVEHYELCDAAFRPKDFQKLREATKELQEWTQVLIDYLESEPNAWLEYD